MLRHDVGNGAETHSPQDVRGDQRVVRFAFREIVKESDGDVFVSRGGRPAVMPVSQLIFAAAKDPGI